MKRICLVILLVSVLFFAVSVSAQDKRFALVIGNNDYKNAPLRNPINDANDMSHALKEVGFSVTTKTNANQREMEDAVRTFAVNSRNGDVALFYFSGHGVQVNGINYLIPTGAKIFSEKDIKYESVEAGRILDELGDAGTKCNIVILDACRNNPFRAVKGLMRGLAAMNSPSGTLIAYSTAPGTVASDGVSGDRNSPYTKALTETMKTPGLKIEDMFKIVRKQVEHETYGRQTPWESTSLKGDFYFSQKSAPQQKEFVRRGRVLIHTANESQGTGAAHLLEYLEGNGFSVQPVENVEGKGYDIPDMTEVRFFHSSDKTRAGEIQTSLKDSFSVPDVKTTYISGYEQKVEAQNFEIWFNRNAFKNYHNRNRSGISGTGASLLIHIADESQRTKADGLLEYLAGNGFSVPPVENVGGKNYGIPNATEVRYFHRTDEAEASELVRIMKDRFDVRNPKTAYIQGYEEKVQPRNFEIWFSF
jgi:hypothetical protein